MLRFSLCILVCAAVTVALTGCGGGGADLGTSTVTGTVTYNGEAVEGASVGFVPSGEGGKMAAGTTDAQGKFTLTTIEAGDGAVPGSYQVSVSKTEGGAAAGGEQTEEEARAAAMPKMGGETGPAPEVKDLLPAKYRDAANSGLTAEVKAGGGNDFPFDLKDE